MLYLSSTLSYTIVEDTTVARHLTQSMEEISAHALVSLIICQLGKVMLSTFTTQKNKALINEAISDGFRKGSEIIG